MPETPSPQIDEPKTDAELQHEQIIQQLRIRGLIALADRLQEKASGTINPQVSHISPVGLPQRERLRMPIEEVETNGYL